MKKMQANRCQSRGRHLWSLGFLRA